MLNQVYLKKPSLFIRNQGLISLKTRRKDFAIIRTDLIAWTRLLVVGRSAYVGFSGQMVRSISGLVPLPTHEY